MMENKEGWKFEKLGEVCVIERGGSPRPIEKFITNDENGINWIKIGDAQEGTMIISSTKEKIKPEGMTKSRYVKKGDFILSNSMSFGKPYILGINGCIHDGWLVIRDENNVFEKSYLYYFLSCKHTYQTFKKMAVGGVVNNLNSKMVRGLIIPIPPLPIQHQIVSELDTLSDIITKKKQQLADLDKLAQATFYDMFGDPVSNEKGWETGKIGDIVTSVNYGTSSPSIIGGKYKYLRMNNLTYGGQINLSDLKFIDVEFSNYEKYVARKGDILFNRTNSKELVGKTICFLEDEEMIIAGYLIRVRVNELFNPIFVSYYMNTHYIKLYLRNLCKNIIGMANINAKELQSIPIYFPPLLLQNQFALKTDLIDKQKIIINQSIADVQQLFDYTMDKYFN